MPEHLARFLAFTPAVEQETDKNRPGAGFSNMSAGKSRKTGGKTKGNEEETVKTEQKSGSKFFFF